MQQYFNLNKDIIYLNHAAVSPWPIKTAEAVKQFATENANVGSQNYMEWLKVEHSLRGKLAKLINAESTNEIALLKSTSEGLSFIAYGLSWKAGDNIVIPAEEFPSNRMVWESLESLGVEVRLVSITNVAEPERALMNAFDDHTRLLSCSSVQYASGFKLNLEKLGSACKRAYNPILFCIDAIQSIGAMVFDTQLYQADFVVADGHKWMMGPEGLALFYCREALLTQLKLNEFGWHMLEKPGEFSSSNTRYSSTATRFECGSPNMTATHALNASLDVIFDVGITTIESLILKNTEYLIEQLVLIEGCKVLSSNEIDRRSGIVLFTIESVESEALYQYLMSQNVMCACRGGGVRFSPHFYISFEVIDRSLRCITQYLKKTVLVSELIEK